jgi:uncharacterized protein YcaQ
VNKRTINWSQVAAFRLARHHFLDQHPADLVRICTDVCGVQAQVMSSARLALWTRNRQIGPPDVERALIEERSVVRASCMRQTLHLLPATEFYIYITALKRSRVEAILRGMSRFGASRKDADRLNEVVLDLLSEGPKTQKEMSKQIRPKVSKQTQAWMDRFWSPVRLAMVEGLVCYGPDRGKDSTIVRTDHWLKRQKRVSEFESQRLLLRGYLSAYGPASAGDFSRWSGVSMKETTPIWNSMADELREVSVGDRTFSVLREDFEALASAKLRETLLRLLPGFDPYLLAHVEKGHLVDDSLYKRVYRNQGWISPVVLLDGRVIGIWSIDKKGKSSSIGIELFEKVSKGLRSRIDQDAASLSTFLATA